ncbi:hypothetical protein OAF54_03145, partial [bacterium]|nr:hypothetical protein [bacterium]
MSTTLIDKLFATGASVTGKAYRMIAARRTRDGATQPLQTDNYGSLNIGFGNLTGTKDIFARLRVSDPRSLFDGAQVLDRGDLKFVDSLVSGGTQTYLPNEASSNLTVTGTSGSTAIRQSRQYIPYEPGRCQYAILTGNMHAAVANVRKRMGYFDASDGIFLEQNGTTDVALTLRSFTSGSVSDAARFTQANWNIDPLDGSGPSGKTLDLSKLVVFFVEFGWLGGAGVRCGFFLDGIPSYVHSFDVSANTTVYMSTPSLPVRYEIVSTAASAGATLKMTCSVVFSEGGFDPAGIVCSQARYTGKSVNTTRSPLISVRLKSAYARGILIPLSAGAMVTSIDDCIGEIVIRGTLTGTPSWVDSDTLHSEYDISATGITGGIRVASFLFNNNAGEIAAKIE